MVKNRMSNVDIRVIVTELQRTVAGLRLANIYDINPKTFLLKFAKPDKKIYVLIESGVRIHTTEFERDKSKMPNSFTLKIRKSIRTRRCESIEQLGVDRVVDFNMGGYHLIAEFYAKGNLILTDADYKILSILRVHAKEEDVGRFAVGELYPVGKRREFAKMTSEALEEGLKSQTQHDGLISLKQALNQQFDYGGGLVEHVIVASNLKPNMKASMILPPPTTSATSAAEVNHTPLSQLLKAFEQADQFIEDCAKSTQKGYIILQDANKNNNNKKNDTTTESSSASTTTTTTTTPSTTLSKEEQRLRYEEFTPFLYHQFKSRQFIEFDSFDKCVDEFFYSMESSKLENQKASAEKTAMKKLEKVKLEQQQRIQELLNNQDELGRKAQLIEDHVEEVDEAIQIIASAVAQAIDWEEIKQVIKEQKKQGDPIAQMIHTLKLEKNQMCMLLYDEQDEEPTKVDIDITVTAYANAQNYYEQRKRMAEKYNKTLETNEQAIKAAEKKSLEVLKKKQVAVPGDIHAMRKRFWFEKFYWFISSENYLVLAGRDAQQNEMLVKRYMTKNDVYVHADIHGAASCIIKNPSGNPIPALTLSEAGTMTVCRSAAWDNKVLTSAYWVTADQVSKTAPSGEYLVTGSFMIRGKKNFLPPTQLAMGLALLFKVDEISLPNHIGERRVREQVDGSNQEDDEQQEEGGEQAVGGAKKHYDLKVREQEQEEDDDDEEENDDDEQDSGSAEDASPSATAVSSAPEEAAANQQQQPEEEKKGGGFSIKDKKRLKKLQQQGIDLETAKQMIIKEKEQQQQAPASGSDSKQQQESKAAEALAASSSAAKKSGKSKKGKKKRRGGDDSSEDDDEDSVLRASLMGQQQHKEQLQKQKKKKSKKPVIAMNANTTTNKKQSSKISTTTSTSTTATTTTATTTTSAISATTTTTVQQQQPTLVEAKQEGEATAIEGASATVEEGGEENKGPKRKSKRARAREEEEEIKKILEEENEKMLSEEDKQKLSELDSLTGNPLQQDVVLFALPVCAPYTTLKNYKYKVKLIPGSQKRGKAGQQALNMMLNDAKYISAEKDYPFVKLVSELDVTGVMVGNVRIATSTTQKKPSAAQKKPAQQSAKK